MSSRCSWSSSRAQGYGSFGSVGGFLDRLRLRAWFGPRSRLRGRRAVHARYRSVLVLLAEADHVLGLGIGRRGEIALRRYVGAHLLAQRLDLAKERIVLHAAILELLRFQLEELEAFLVNRVGQLLAAFARILQALLVQL